MALKLKILQQLQKISAYIQAHLILKIILKILLFVALSTLVWISLSMVFKWACLILKIRLSYLALLAIVNISMFILAAILFITFTIQTFLPKYSLNCNRIFPVSFVVLGFAVIGVFVFKLIQ